MNLNLVLDLGRLPSTSKKIHQQHFTIIKPSYSLMSDHMNSATSVLLIPVVVTLEPPASQHNDWPDTWVSNQSCMVQHSTSRERCAKSRHGGQNE